jgi:hypothetical protein
VDTTFMLIVGGTTSFDDVLQKPAQSIVVNNYSNQWVELLDANDTFVPPYIVNMIVPVGGGTRFRASFASPTGVPQAATIAGQRVAIEVFETALNPNAGQIFPVRAPSTEWRNPKGLSFFVRQAFPGPVAYSVDWSYTVPAGRRARVDTAQVYAELSVSDGSGAGTLVSAGIDFYPLGVSATTILEASIWTGVALGARADGAISAGKDLQATDRIVGASGNLRGAGVTVRAMEAAIITEGDA